MLVQIPSNAEYMNEQPGFKKLRELIQQIKYAQRDFTAHFLEHFGPPRPDAMYWLHLTTLIRDASTGEDMIFLGKLLGLCVDWPEEKIVREIYNEVRTIELHELDEHFFFRNIKTFDPHQNTVKIV